MIKVFGLVFIILLLTAILKESNRTFSLVISIAGVLILLTFSIGYLSELISFIKSISDKVSGLNSYLTLMIKLLGISVCTQVVSSLCKDSGEQALATQTELYSKLFMLISSLPLFESVITIISGLVK